MSAPDDSDPEPPRGNSEETIFSRALELPASERDAFLNAECGKDRVRRNAFAALLAAHDRSDELPGPSPGLFGSRGLQDALLREFAGEDVGAVIGRYTLIERIADGGFGTVYLARRRDPVGLRVALKILKPGMDTRQIVARFEAEREALARMDHPNIARIYDAGATDSGRPYFAMEFIDGVPVTEFCEAHALDVKQRLVLFIKICSAVGHAHSKGVIHRDLKPGNVLARMRDGTPEVKVIDFGIAKALEASVEDSALLTRAGQFLGTPAYISPEQAASGGRDVDTRSDVYGLGLLLYEMLAGQPPFDPRTLLAAGDVEMRRIIREQDPPRPSTRRLPGGSDSRVTAELESTLRSDLDWIVMKAIEKDRERRYGTANALSDEIGRFLAGEAVLAGPPSATYRIRKFARRHRAALAVSSCFVVILAAAAVGGTWLAIRARAAEHRAEVRLAAEKTARAEAEELTNLMTGVFRSPNHNVGRTVTVVETLDAAARHIETSLANQPERRAAIQAALGKGYNVLGLFEEAVALREAVLEYRLQTAGPDHPDTLRAKHDLAVSYQNLGRNDDSTRLHTEILASRRANPALEGPTALAEAIELLAIEHLLAGRIEQSSALRAELLELCMREFGPTARSTLEAKCEVADARAVEGKLDEAIALCEDILRTSTDAFGPADPLTTWTLGRLAHLYARVGDRKRAIELAEQQLAVFTGRPDAYLDKQRSMNALGLMYVANGQVESGLALLQRVLEIRKKTLGLRHQDTHYVLETIGQAHLQLGRLDEARAAYETILANVHPESDYQRRAQSGLAAIEQHSAAEQQTNTSSTSP